MTTDRFSLMRGGPLYRVLRRLGALGPGKHPARLIAIAMILVAIGPLLAMAAWNGTLLPGYSQVTMPLLGDFDLLARFLVVMPLLVLAAPVCDALLHDALIQFSRSSMVHPVRRSPFDTIMDRMRRARDSSLPETACLLLAIVPAMLLHTMPLGMLHDVSDWRMADGALTPAGQWFVLVSTSLHRFLILIWTWRFLLWAWMLWRFSRMELDLQASHPDGAGGLGFLGVIQQRFAVLAFAGGALVAGTCINRIQYLDENVTSQVHLLLGYVVTCSLVIVAPLLMLSPRMLAVKRKSLMLYSVLGHQAAHMFDRRWLVERAPDAPTLLDAGDASALCDFTSVYATVSGMSVVPISRRNLVWIAVSASLPLTPLVFFALSFDELLLKLNDILL